MSLALQAIGKRFRLGGEEVVALKDVSLEVAPGELAVVVGPSGCGKSTLLNIVAGLERASSGRALLGGREITGPGADRGMVFQSYTLFPWLTVRKNVEFGLRMKGMPAPERMERARRYLDLVGLKDFEDARPGQLSGGMKQRVAIARVLANRPEMLLMDEPFGALDAQTRLLLQELLLRVWQKHKTTILFITHDIDEAILLADRIFIMSRRPGRILSEMRVDIERPRDHTVTVTPRFAAIKTAIMELLWREIAQD